MKSIFTEIQYRDMEPVKSVEIGEGDVCIMDISCDEEGRASIGFISQQKLEVGSNGGFDGKPLNKVSPELIIITSNIQSLEILLDKVQRAIGHLKVNQTENDSK